MAGTVFSQYTRDVVVTGFDSPFEEYEENPSSAVVDELMKETIENVKIIPHKLPTTYEGVVEKLPDLRINYPDEVIHIAAHTVKKTIYFVDRAFFDGYCREDKTGYAPKDFKIECEDEEDEEQKVRKPFIDFEYLVEEVTYIGHFVYSSTSNFLSKISASKNF
ncbi:hypothetical protein CAEBREN_16528 [Caenorhabditis brenneri]|uniref:Uncharacterized protein n=1 Tax=Caenorhabditis brenneri TaxID=135651 RepID=G0MLY7_CAEBE|nr:hypothetical protein CAEBREN_16528 [Caenorhabditis brenneri]